MTTIRMACEGDGNALLGIYAPFCETTAVSFETAAPTQAEMARRIRETLIKFPWLVAERDGVVAGYAYASSHRQRAAYRWSVETTAYIGEGQRRNGIGRTLYQGLLTILRRQGFANALAGITLPNPASVGFHEALGFRPIGVYRKVGYKLGAWHDVGWWQLELQPYRLIPAEPKDLSEVMISLG
jgi:L-amino acid N-acyltransferase YncA